MAGLVRAAYDLSSPQGLGFLHYKEGVLSDELVENIINQPTSNSVALRMDYIRGRACKLTVFKRGDRLFIGNEWYDHTESQLNELLDRVEVVR